jgi:hypothetical protein
MKGQYQFHHLEQSQDEPSSRPRSIDDYLESAYWHHQTNLNYNISLSQTIVSLMERWRYYIIFLALGIANSGDSAEMGCTNFLLSSESFQSDVSFGFAQF